MIYSAALATIFRQINQNSFQQNTTNGGAHWWATLKTYFYPIYDKRRANVISKKLLIRLTLKSMTTTRMFDLGDVLFVIKNFA